MRTLLLFVCILCSMDVFAQRGGGRRPGMGNMPANGKIQGWVRDSLNQEGLEYATISVYNRRDSSLTGTVSDRKGYFMIDKLKPGMYRVGIQFLGYEKKTLSIRLSPREGGFERDLGVIMLSPSSQQLEAVVRAEKPLILHTIDKKIFNVEQDITSESGSANEVLNNIPSVDVDIDGNISLRGSGNVTVLIDGKPSGMTGSSRQAILEQLPASSIESIEVITNPSVKYDPDGMSGIINIILKKQNLKGFNGSVTVNAGTGEKYNGSTQMNWRSGKWNTFWSYSYRYDNRTSEGTNLRTTDFGDSLATLDQINTGSRLRSSHVIKLGTDYSPNTFNSFMASATYNPSSGDEVDRVDYTYLDDQNNITEIRVRDNKEDQARYSMDYNMGYIRTFRRDQQKLTADVRYSLSNRTNVGKFVENSFLPDQSASGDPSELQNNYTDDQNQVITVQTDYIHPLSDKAKFEAGYKSIFRSIDNDFRSETWDTLAGEFTSDVLLNNVFEYAEQIHAVYGIYARSFGKVGIQLGTRVEQAYTDSRLVTTKEDFSNDYFSLYPSAHFAYNFTDRNELKLSYSRRINRPRIRSLNPFTDYSDPLNLRHGNPFLKPEYIDAVELGHYIYWKKLTLSSAIYYRQINDLIRRLSFVDSIGVSHLSYSNFSTAKSYGAELIATIKPKPWINTTLSGNVSQTKTDGSNIDADLTSDAFRFSGKLLSTFKVKKKLDIQLTGRYRAPFEIPQGKILEMYNIDAALKYRILKDKGSVSLRLSDVFNSRQFRIELERSNYVQESWRKRESRILYASFSYRFGKMEERKNRRNREGRPSEGGNEEFDMR